MLSPSGQADLKKIAEADGTGSFDEERTAAGGNIAKHTGCTSVVVLVTKDAFYCANAGDSRSVLARKQPNGSLEVIALSDDHKPDNLDEKKRIEAAGGFVEENRVNGSLNLSRSLGDFEYKSNTSKNYKDQMVTCFPEVRKVTRSDRDSFLVLACDGIWDCLNNEECVQMLQKHMAARNTANLAKATATCVEQMFDKIVAKDILQSSGLGTDNMTAVIIEFLR